MTAWGWFALEPIVSNDFISDTIALIHGIKDVLLRLQQLPTDPAIANSIPSTTTASHNMTGIYGWEHVVAFMSAIEGVLSKIRNDELLCVLANRLITLKYLC